MVTSTAANITFEPFSDFLFARVRVILYQVEGAHHHARRAEAALEAVIFAKSFLHRVQSIAVGHSLDRGYVGSIALYRQNGAAFHRLAVFMDDAGAALAGVATDMSAGHPKMLAQELHQKCAGFHVAADGLSVHGHRNSNGHRAFLPGLRPSAAAPKFFVASLAASRYYGRL
jgi:hypothetical protein